MDQKEKLRFQRIKRVYGLTKEQYEQLYTDSCCICLRPYDDTVHPVVDHDHVSGLIRGIICTYCNHRLVGRHRDGMLVRRIADYLDAPRPGWVVPKKKKRKKKCLTKKTTTKTSTKLTTGTTRKTKSKSTKK